MAVAVSWPGASRIPGGSLLPSVRVPQYHGFVSFLRPTLIRLPPRPPSDFSALLGILLILAGCSGPESVDVSLRDLSFTVPSQSVDLNEALDSVTFAAGCPQQVRVRTVYLNNVGHQGIILPAGCSFQLSAPVAEQGRLSARFGLRPGDWNRILKRKIGLPTVIFAIEHGALRRELLRIDFRDPEWETELRWLHQAVEFAAADVEEITLVVRIEPEAGYRRQAQVLIADLLVLSFEPISLSLDEEAKIVRVPQGFRKQMPDAEEAGELFRQWTRNRRLFDLALGDAPDSRVRKVLPAVVAAQEESFQDFVGKYSEELFWELWDEIPQELAPRLPSLPDLVVSVVDCGRRDHFSAYGYERETTTIDTRLAAEGIIFMEAYSTGSATNFSMPTMMTGHYAAHHQFNHHGMKLPEYEQTLAEYLRGNGYLTLGITTNPYLSVGSGMERGFFAYDAMGRYFAPYPKAEHVFARAEEWLAYFRWFPTFLYIHLMDAHGPYRPSPPFDSLFDGVPYSKQDNTWIRRVATPFLENDTFKLPAVKRPGYANIARVKNLYDGELRYADHHLSRFLDRMTELHLFDAAAIVVSSDHGEEFFEHGFTFHNSIPHEEKIRIPLIIKPHRGYPVHGPIRVNGRVDGVLNLFPTVLELVGLPAPEGLHGVSLMPLVHASARDETSVLFHDNEWFRAVRSGPWKLVTTTLSKEAADEIPEFKIMGGYQDMLFHLESDPQERVNLIDREPQVAQELRELIERKFAAITRQREQAASGLEAKKRELDEKTQERLRALGYLD